jgi:NADH-quinone oxidoreductase subunit L
VQGLAPAVEKKWYVDAFYMAAIVNPIRRASEWMAAVLDQKVIDGAVNGIAKLSATIGERARYIETGAIPTYALSILIGVVALVVFFVMNA